MTPTPALPPARRGRRIAVALAALSLAWLAAPGGGAPPLYDGLGAPDEPYRYVDPPDGYRKTAPPGSAVADVTTSSHNPVIIAASDEQAPQITLRLIGSDLAPPVGSALVHLRGKPVHPTTAPRNLYGNVYEVTATASGRPLTLRSSNLDLLIMRSPDPPAFPVSMEYNNGTGWRQLATFKIGYDIYECVLVGFGEYGITKNKPTANPTQRASGNSAGSVPARRPGGSTPAAHAATVNRALVAVLGTALATLIASIIAIRIRRRPRQP